MDAALSELQTDVATCQSLENGLRGKQSSAEPKTRASKGARKGGISATTVTRSVDDVLAVCIDACKDSRKRHRAEAGAPDDTSDHGLSQYTRFTDEIALDVYKDFLHYVPRLVNVVTVRVSTSMTA